MTSTNNLKWKENKLYLKDKLVAEIVPFIAQEGMYRIKWPDGTKSNDFYNLTRAKDNAVKIVIEDTNLKYAREPQK